jgi:hypothetical protein
MHDLGRFILALSFKRCTKVADAGESVGMLGS